MITSAQNKPISELLGIDATWHFEVPRYQREYVWKREQWEHLFDDLWGNDPGYFLGSMITVNRSADSTEAAILEVIDGQQRLTTISLLYAATYWCLTQCKEADKNLEYDLHNLRKRLVFREKPVGLRIDPSRQEDNHLDYRAILQDAGILKGVSVPANAGNRRLFKAYRFFIDRLDELDKRGRRVFNIVQVRDLLTRLNQASMVNIQVATHSDAFTLFESLNNRGLPLSAMDLVKNRILAVLEKRDAGSIDENFNRWLGMLQSLTDSPVIQERFLRQHYNAFKHDPKVAVPKIQLATRSKIIRIYDHLATQDAEALLNNLVDRSKLYGRLIAPSSDGLPARLANALRDLDRIGGAPAYTLLLYLLAERPSADIAAICRFLVRYFVRRNLTDIPPTRDLDRLFISTIEAVRKGARGREEAIVRNELLTAGRVASNAEFAEMLGGPVYSDNVDATRFILCAIEARRQTKEKFRDLWERDEQGNYIWTVEHIFPQGSNIPDCWVKMIAGGDKAQAKASRERFVHRLGNLTLSGYNSKLGNKSFAEKRDRKDQRGRLVGYRNGLYLNRALRSKTRWQVEDIESRTQQLAKEAVRLFKL